MIARRPPLSIGTQGRQRKPFDVRRNVLVRADDIGHQAIIPVYLFERCNHDPVVSALYDLLQ
jgi:hypothetical protein